MTGVPTAPAPAVPRSGLRAPLPRGRLLLLAFGGLSLLAGLDAALLLAGLPAPVTAERLAAVHGQLMLFGFLGTLIALERAIAVRATWAYAAPLGFGVGGLLLVSPAPLVVGQALQAAGAAMLLAVYTAVGRRAASVAVTVQSLGAVLALAAGLLWLTGMSTAALFGCLTGFLILTIAGERLELARIAMPSSSAESALLLMAATMVVAAIAAVLWPRGGTELLGASVLAIVAWLARFDVAVRLVRATGLTRYIAVNLLAGLCWLAVAGATWLLLGPQLDGPGFDLVVHCIGLGFAFSMVLAHAPVILPAVIRRPLPYSAVLYGVTALLQVSVVVRVLGDVRALGGLWQAGAAANVVAMLLFLAVTVALVVRR